MPARDAFTLSGTEMNATQAPGRLKEVRTKDQSGSVVGFYNGYRFK
jgi:hypothetical protein